MKIILRYHDDTVSSIVQLLVIRFYAFVSCVHMRYSPASISKSVQILLHGVLCLCKLRVRCCFLVQSLAVIRNFTFLDAYTCCCGCI